MRVAMAVLAVFVAGGPSAVRDEPQLAFTRGEDGSRAWVMRSDGRGQHRLPIRTLPAQSPEGKWLAWWTQAGPRPSYTSRLLVTRSDWRGAREVARFDGYKPCFAPQWSP